MLVKHPQFTFWSTCKGWQIFLWILGKRKAEKSFSKKKSKGFHSFFASLPLLCTLCSIPYLMLSYFCWNYIVCLLKEVQCHDHHPWQHLCPNHWVDFIMKPGEQVSPLSMDTLSARPAPEYHFSFISHKICFEFQLKTSLWRCHFLFFTAFYHLKYVQINLA